MPPPTPEPPAPEPEAEPEPPRSSLDLPEPVDSAEISRGVAIQILSHPDYTVFDHVQFQLDAGTVTLIGAVTSTDKKESLTRAVKAVPGVMLLENELRVLSSSKEDERLRETLFRRIYEDPSFAEYAELKNPPIHILVDSKHVTLTGVVDALILQMSAEAIVRTTFGVRSVRNEIRVRKP